MPHNLFVYGTLMAPEVIQRVVGLVPRSEPACLRGYQRFAIAGADFPAIIRSDAGKVCGLLYRNLKESVLAALDDYEGEWYSRETVRVQIKQGQDFCMALGYLLKPEYCHHLTGEEWDFDEFRRLHLGRYLDQL